VAEVAGASSGDGNAEFEDGRDLSRVVFFSDAVFAISMTILALTLSLPAGTTDAEVANALDKAIPSIFTYALSFAVIAIYWLPPIPANESELPRLQSKATRSPRALVSKRHAIAVDASFRSRAVLLVRH
jgi:hypothetical protein